MQEQDTLRSTSLRYLSPSLSLARNREREREREREGGGEVSLQKKFFKWGEKTTPKKKFL